MKPSAEREQAARAWVSAWSGQAPQCFEYLSGGYSNANYRVRLGPETYVLRFCEAESLPGIDRAREREHIVRAGSLAPELVHYELPSGHMITRLVPGRHPLPGERREGDLEAAVRLLRAVHALAPVAYRYDPIAIVRRYLDTAARLGARLPDALANTAAQVRQGTASHFCHNDFNPWNLVVGEAEQRVLDWEWSGMGDPLFDLAGLAVTHALEAEETEHMLRVYFGAELAGEHQAGLRAQLAQAQRLYWLREGAWALLQMARGSHRDEIEQQLAASLRRLGR